MPSPRIEQILQNKHISLGKKPESKHSVPLFRRKFPTAVFPDVSETTVYLNLETNPCGDDVFRVLVSAIATSTTLEHLVFSAQHMTIKQCEAIVDAISHSPTLLAVDCYFPSVTPRNIQLSNTLKYLRIGGNLNEFSESLTNAIGNAQSLEMIDLFWIDPEGTPGFAQQLAKSIPNSNTLKAIMFSMNQFSNTDTIDLLRAFKSCKKLEAVQLCETSNVTSNDNVASDDNVTSYNYDIAVELAAYIANSTQLRYLDISGGNYHAGLKFGTNGCVALANALSQNPYLEYINLNYVTLGTINERPEEELNKLNFSYNPGPGNRTRYGRAVNPDASTALVKALATHTSLRHVSLRELSLRSQGATYVAQLINNNKNLSFLNVSYNMLGHEGGMIIAKALKSNQTLEVLYLSDNDIGGKAADAILTALDSNTNIKTCVICSNDLHDSLLGDNNKKQLNELHQRAKALEDRNKQPTALRQFSFLQSTDALPDDQQQAHTSAKTSYN